jgi:hypothetical protein
MAAENYFEPANFIVGLIDRRTGKAHSAKSGFAVFIVNVGRSFESL